MSFHPFKKPRNFSLHWTRRRLKLHLHLRLLSLCNFIHELTNIQTQTTNLSRSHPISTRSRLNPSQIPNHSYRSSPKSSFPLRSSPKSRRTRRKQRIQIPKRENEISDYRERELLCFWANSLKHGTIILSIFLFHVYECQFSRLDNLHLFVGSKMGVLAEICCRTVCHVGLVWLWKWRILFTKMSKTIYHNIFVYYLSSSFLLFMQCQIFYVSNIFPQV